MVGIIIGTVCLVGLVKVVGRRHGYRGHSCRGHYRRRRHISSPRDRMEHLFDELDLSEEQEDKVKDHVRAYRKRVRKLKAERERSAEDIAAAMRSESFDENILGEMFARHDDVMRELRKDSVELLAHVHYILDERQRTKLASIIDGGPSFGFHPYRWARS